MDFYEYQTTYDLVRRQGLATSDAEEFYREALAVCLDMARRIDRHRFAVEFNKTKCEWDWDSLGRPYFKIFPAMIPLLSDVNVDVPIEYLRPPFASFLVRLPMQDNPLIVEGEYHVRTILVAEGRPDGDEDDRRIYLWIDVGERDPTGGPILTYCQLPCESGLSSDDAFTRLPMEPDTPGLVVTREFQARCLRLAVLVSFLATGQDRLIEPLTDAAMKSGSRPSSSGPCAEASRAGTSAARSASGLWWLTCRGTVHLAMTGTVRSPISTSVGRISGCCPAAR